MSAVSFLKEELQKIDSKVSQKITTFTLKDISLVDLLPFAATEEVFFFESKEEDFSYLALGKSKFFLKSDVQEFLDNNPDDILVYQDSFEEDSATLCYLPEWCLVRRNGVVTLRVHHSLEYQSYSPSNIIFNLAVWESFTAPWVSFEDCMYGRNLCMGQLWMPGQAPVLTWTRGEGDAAYERTALSLQRSHTRSGADLSYDRLCVRRVTE